MNETIFGAKKDIFFMQKALDQAKCAFENDEVPVGAIVVDAHGIIIARGYNQVERLSTQNAHAEVLAIKKAGGKLRNWRLLDCWLYVTLEPCSMCMALADLSRLRGVVYGATSPLFGYQLDKGNGLAVYKKGAPEIITGVLEQESSMLLKQFFQKKRKKKGEWVKT